MKGIALAVVWAVQAQAPYKRELPPALARQAKIAETVAAESARARVPKGIIQAVELEREHGRLIYSYDIKVPGRSGVEEVNVNAVTGKVVGVGHESARDEAAESARGPDPRRPRRRALDILLRPEAGGQAGDVPSFAGPADTAPEPGPVDDAFAGVAPRAVPPIRRPFHPRLDAVRSAVSAPPSLPFSPGPHRLLRPPRRMSPLPHSASYQP